MATSRPSPPRLLRVKKLHDLSPNLRRITLHGEDLAGFPQQQAGAHIKLMLPQAWQATPVLPTLGPQGPIWPAANLRPITRTYTVARYCPLAGELDVDFVLHGDNGPASRWACNALPGDAIGVAGPGGVDRYQAGADWFFLVGDLSALGMIAAVLAELPNEASGHALIEVDDAAEIRPLSHPANLQVHWLVRAAQIRAGHSTLLLDTVRSLAWPSGQASVSLAGESSQVVAIRDYLLHERGLPRQQLYAVPYWKDQYDEEAYHQERHRIMDELAEVA